MIPEEFKQGLAQRLRDEAARMKSEKEEKLRLLHREKLEELRRKYQEEAEKFAKSLS